MLITKDNIKQNDTYILKLYFITKKLYKYIYRSILLDKRFDL